MFQSEWRWLQTLNYKRLSIFWKIICGSMTNHQSDTQLGFTAYLGVIHSNNCGSSCMHVAIFCFMEHLQVNGLKSRSVSGWCNNVYISMSWQSSQFCLQFMVIGRQIVLATISVSCIMFKQKQKNAVNPLPPSVNQLLDIMLYCHGVVCAALLQEGALQLSEVCKQRLRKGKRPKNPIWGHFTILITSHHTTGRWWALSQVVQISR